MDEGRGWLLKVEVVAEVGRLASKPPDGGRVEVDCVLYRAVVVVEGTSVEEAVLATVRESMRSRSCMLIASE